MGLTQAEIEKAERKGWKVGTVTEFLGLSPEEELNIEMRLRLTMLLRERRTGLKISQRAFAKRLGSSQSRVAKIEANDPSVSLDLLIKAVGATGATISDVADAISQGTHP
ncbi:MAG TPA: helix-turn-helix transcriptional regulator [Capsulimonadaceae bacterium]|jgi:DNA-binding XRE family transcriptional regulator